MALRIQNAASRSARSAEIDADGLFMDIALTGDYKDSKTLAVAEGETLVFEEIPVGATVKAQGTAYRTENGERLVLYKGESDTTSRTLGVGLKHNRRGLAWCTDSANAYSKKIDTILCEPDDWGSAGNYTWTGEQDKDGSDNLSQIAAFLPAEGSGTTDDTATQSNHPAFYFAKNYKETATNLAGTAYEDGWYLPSLAELFQIYANGKGTNNVFDLDAASQALGGDQFSTSGYWSSSQYASYDNNACKLSFSNGDWGSRNKCNYNDYVCALRAFN